MYHPVHVEASTREEAIEKALARQPAHIPAGTELYYGLVGGQPVGHAINKGHHD
jgi:hypothetical protein